MKCCAETDSTQLTAVTGTRSANIYNKKTKGPTLMELFTATGKLIFFWGGGQLETFDVRTKGDTAHIDTIFKFLPHASACVFSACTDTRFQ